MPDIAAGWAALEGQVESVPAPSERTYRHYRPLSDAVTRFVHEAQDTKRIFTGIDPFDREMRGIGAGHLCFIVGYNHSGKTLLFLHMLRKNRDKRVALFIPDEPQALVLAKLASISSGVPAVELERRVAIGDAGAIALLRETAAVEFPNLIVFDKPMIPGDMEYALSEAEDVWGAAPDLIAVDFLDLVQAGDSVQAKAEFIKGFGARHETALICLHQTSRSAGAEVKAMTISSGAMGGEAYATFQIGVWRKKAAIAAEMKELEERVNKSGSESARERLESLRYDMSIHQYTLTANLNKNKRPGGSLVEEINFELFGDTGQLVQLAPGDLPSQYRASVSRPPTDQPTVDASWHERQMAIYDDDWFNPYEDT